MKDQCRLSPPINIFISYARKDKPLRNGLISGLAPLRRTGTIELHYDEKIQAGAPSQKEISRLIHEADIILLLLSSDYFESDQCYEIERPQAMEREQRGQVVVIPILIRPVAWKNTGLGQLTPLPGNARPVVKWRPREEAWCDVAYGLEEVVSKLLRHGPVPRPSKLEEVLQPFNRVSHEIGQSIDRADSIWLMTRTGRGWWHDFPEIDRMFDGSQEKGHRLLVLNPESPAFDSRRYEWTPWHFNREQTFDQYRSAAQEHLRSLMDKEKKMRRKVVRRLNVIPPLVLLVINPGSIEDGRSVMYVEYPTFHKKARYQGKPVVTVTSEDREIYSGFYEAYEELWNQGIE